VSKIVRSIVLRSTPTISHKAHRLFDCKFASFLSECNPPGVVNYESCVENGQVGLITCSKDFGFCPIFFAEGATQRDDTVSGAAALIFGIICLAICLTGLVMVLKKMLLGTSEGIIRKATNLNGYVSMVFGAGITVLVQSSSVTTSVLTPLVGVGLITLEQVLSLVEFDVAMSCLADMPQV
jgi:hypothetical protein